MAPELFEEGATHSTASDLWAAGCVLYECLTGQPPFVKRTLAQLMGAILHEQHGPLEGVSPELCDLVGRMLDKNPATRITWAVGGGLRMCLDVVIHVIHDVPSNPHALFIMCFCTYITLYVHHGTFN